MFHGLAGDKSPTDRAGSASLAGIKTAISGWMAGSYCPVTQ
jgi:hypothetical protein